MGFQTYFLFLIPSPEATLMAISVMGPLWGKIPFHYGVGHSAAYRKLPFRNGAHYGVTVMGSEMPLGCVQF